MNNLSYVVDACQVYAVEAASGMCVLSRIVIAANGYADRVTVLQGDASHMQLPGNILADVLISEWMGFYLLHESMLDAVVAARDRLLRPGAAMFPSTATLSACPVALKEYCAHNFDFWNDVCGFDMSAVASVARQKCLSSPEVITLPKNALLAQPQQLLSIDLQYVNADDVSTVMSSLEFVVTRNEVMHGFALWFDVSFDGRSPVTLDTSPLSPPTHWQQTVVMLPDALLVNRDSVVQCRMLLQRAEVNRRQYNITVEMIEIDNDDDEDDDESMNSVSTKQMIKDAMNKVI